MRHGKKFNHLGRTSAHRKAMLSNMASSLILNKRIATTVAKAKELRKYVEPLLTRAKTDSTHSRRVVFSYLQNKDSVNTLFTEVAEKISTRPGGYTRILKTGARLGDNSDMCIIELVDYNELYSAGKDKGAKSAKRSRRGGGKSKAAPQAEAETAQEAASGEEKVKKAPKAAAKSEDSGDEKAKSAEKKEPKNKKDS